MILLTNDFTVSLASMLGCPTFSAGSLGAKLSIPCGGASQDRAPLKTVDASFEPFEQFMDHSQQHMETMDSNDVTTDVDGILICTYLI